MLKNIGLLFESKKKAFDKSQDINSQINSSIRDFLKEKFGEDLKGYSVVIKYNSTENSLTIRADNKILANELTLCLAELNSVLKRDKIRLNRILVR